MATYDILTPKQEAFCQYYVQGMTPIEAALKAGYKPNSAGEQGSQNLNKLKIKNRIEELRKPIQQAVNKELIITRERLARNILKIAEPSDADLPLTRKGDIIKANELLIKLFGVAEPEKQDINITGVQVVTKDQEMSSLINSLKLK